MTALRRKMLRDLSALRAQMATTGILVACGVSLLVSMWSSVTSLETTRDAYYRADRFADIFAELKRAPMGIARKLSILPGVDIAEPRIVMDGLVEGSPAIGRFISLEAGREPALNRVHLKEGRLPSQAEETEAVVHEGFAKANGLRIGSRLVAVIQGQRETFRIVGIGLSPEYLAEIGPGAPFPDDRRFGVFWVTRDALERIARMPDAFNSVTVRLSPGAAADAVKSRVDSLLKTYGSRGAYGRDRQPSARLIADDIYGLRARAIITPTFFLAVAAFLVHVIASRLIGMQRTQIATLKAVGYSGAEVARHYLALIAAMMIVGVPPGVLLGWLFGKLIFLSFESVYRFPVLAFSISPASVAIGFLAAIVPGLLGAWVSVRSAFRISPAEAMRPPAPPAFHASLFEKLGIQGRVSIRGRMAWRNLLLRPLRLGLTVLGLAMASCLVVASLAWSDIIGFFLSTSFQRIQREDLSVSFIKPLPVDALQELSRRRGVRAVEGYRVVPMRMKYLNHLRELMVTGWSVGASMRQRLDKNLAPIALPREGVLLSRWFHEDWGMKEGERVELETVEGEPKRLSVRVAGFTDDLVGTSAAMEIGELWRALGEEAGYNFATLLVDPRLEPQLYVELQNYPEILSVNLKRAAYLGFEETMGMVMHVVSAIMILFSLAIAGGVIYNSVRVSFSERAWELASLRVLGFDRRQAFGVLVSEVTAQVLLSLVPGCVFGYWLTGYIMRLARSENFDFPVIIQADTYSVAMLTVVAGLGLSGLAVRRMMARLSLVEALKARE